MCSYKIVSIKEACIRYCKISTLQIINEYNADSSNDVSVLVTAQFVNLNICIILKTWQF